LSGRSGFNSFGIRTDLSENKSSEAKRKPSEAVGKQKAKLCAARIDAQVPVV
jgi:hypothetical protein